MWIDGTALFRSLYRSIYARPSRRFEPLVRYVIVTRIGTWAALAVELVLPFGLWFDETRRPAIVANTLLHLGIMTMFRMKAFQLIMMATGALFLSDAEVAWVARATHIAFPAAL
jgi:hypothetical protein